MANRQREPVSYRPFRTEPLLAEGLLAVSRPGGALLERTSQALFRFAAQQGDIADRQAARAGAAAGERAALEGRPSASITGETSVGGAGRARGGRFAPEVNSAIDNAAARHGVDAATLRTIAQIESGGNPRAKNPTSSAGGLFQFIDGTARQYGLKDRYNAGEAADAGARLMRDNRNHLRRVLGRDPTPGELYLAHQQGAGGAAKLLRNPDASAVSVVGEKAVRLNGGRPGMTAGEFAQLWIRKAENGYAIPSEPSQIDPSITVSGGRFRPSGSDTIYGRAYDEAGTKAYLQMIDSEMRSTTQQAFELYRDDPAQLETVLGTLKGQLKKDHIFQEIELDYELGFDNLSQRYIGQARENQRLKIEAQDKADFIDRTNELETSQQRLLADFDPKNPDAGSAIAGAQAAIDAHYDSAVDRGIMSPSAAAEAKARSSRSVAVGFYEAQAKSMSAEELPALREKMKADFAAGKLDGVDGAGWAALESRLIALENSKLKDEANAQKALAERGARIAARVEAGFDYDPAELSRLQLDAGMTPQGEEIVAGVMAMIDTAEIFRDRPIGEARAHVVQMRKGLGKTPTDAQISALAYAEKRLAALEELVVKDPVAYEVATGRTELGIIDTTSPETLAASLATRRDQMDAISERYGSPYQFFRPHERTVLANALTENPDSFPEFVTALSEALGDRTSTALAELSEDAPTLAHAAGLAIATKDNSISVELARAISAKREGLFKAKMPAAEKFVTAAGPTLAGALSGLDRTRAATLETAQLLFEADANRIGFDAAELNKEGTPAAMAWRRALERALGAQYVGGRQTGGLGDVNGGSVVVPTGMEPKLPQRLMSRINDEMLKKLPPIRSANGVDISAAQLRRARLMTVGDGIYRVALGDPDGWDPQYVVGVDGDFWTLDMRQLERLADTTRRRPTFGWQVPDAIE